MIITCPECLTKFRLDENKIPERAAKARCCRCQYVFQLQKPASPEDSFFSPGETLGEFGEAGKDKGLRRGRFLHWKWALVVLAVFVLIGSFFYFGRGKVSQYFSKWGKVLEEKTADLKEVSLNLPFLKKYLAIGDPGEGFFSLEKVRGYYLENNNLNRIFVVEGEAANHWKGSRSFVRVRGALLDSRGNKVREQEAFCGNILSEKDLKEMSREAIEKSLSSQFGISFSNVNIVPNKSVPFMIVFTDLPREEPQSKSGPESGARPTEVPARLSDFTVEVTGSQKGSK